MTTADKHHSSSIVKALYIGDSSTGKTGSLASLVIGGYKLRVLDMDNGLDPLVNFTARHDKKLLKNIDYETRRDKYQATRAGPIIKGSPRAYTEALGLLSEWSDGSEPAEWGPDTIFVLDTLTSLGKAAFEWAKGMNPTAKDPRQWYFTAQQSIEVVLAMITSAEFNCNVLVLSHVQYKEIFDGTTRGYTNAVGSALGPIIPNYFNTLLVCERTGFGKTAKRSIVTIPTTMVSTKNPAPWRLEDTYPIEDGMMKIFEALTKGEKK